MGRLRWHDLPEQIRAAAERALGSSVARDVPQSGGFSPGLASRLTLHDGQRVFAKAVGSERNARSPELHRREIAIMQALPHTLPTPTLQWEYDDGDWVVLVLDDVDGTMPDEPWRPDQLRQAMTALEQLAERLNPSPIETLSIQDDLKDNFRSWSALAETPEMAGRLDPWAQRNLEWLADLESGWAQAAEGESLLHTDLRADNMLITPDGVIIVDWPYAVRGAAWVDAVMFLPSVAAQTLVDLDQIWSEFAPARGADGDAVNAVLAAVAGDFLYQSLLPAPENIPSLREHQHSRGQAALTWLRSRVS